MSARSSPPPQSARLSGSGFLGGTVTKIELESEPGQYNQATSRVELTVENTDGLLRHGMTAFARIDIDRQMIGQILIAKIKRALRPEL
jgi:hypothetical protein